LSYYAWPEKIINILSKNVFIGEKINVFEAESSESGHAKTALATKVANYFCNVFFCFV
jgi:hypothetical protein